MYSWNVNDDTSALAWEKHFPFLGYSSTVVIVLCAGAASLVGCFDIQDILLLVAPRDPSNLPLAGDVLLPAREPYPQSHLGVQVQSWDSDAEPSF